MKYSAVYKCTLCGAMIRPGEPQEISEAMLPAMLARVIKDQQVAGNVFLHTAPMYIPHLCRNGGGGMAYFSGFRREDEQ